MPAPADPRPAAERDCAEELLVAQGAALRRLGRLAAESADEKIALRAAEAVLKFAGQCRRDETHVKVAALRDETARLKVAARTAPPVSRQPWPAGRAEVAPATPARPKATADAPPG